MEEILNKLKNRWGVQSTRHVLIIFILFAITGYSTLHVSSIIKDFFGLDNDYSFGIKVFIFFIIDLPVYFVLFYVWGVLMGQKKFVERFLSSKFRFLSGSNGKN